MRRVRDCIQVPTPESETNLLIGASFEPPRAESHRCGARVFTVSSGTPSWILPPVPAYMSASEFGPPFPPETSSPVTDLLLQVRPGDTQALDRLMMLVYDELHALAHRKLGFEQTGHTLQTTALVHEAYLKLVNQRQTNWQNRAHFFAVAAVAMRRILVKHAEGRRAAKRGGNVVPLHLDDAFAVPAEIADDRLLALDDALDRLERFNERGARVVEYRFFGGLSYDDIATTMGLSSITVRRAWESSRAWLRRELDSDFESSAE